MLLIRKNLKLSNMCQFDKADMSYHFDSGSCEDLIESVTRGKADNSFAD